MALFGEIASAFVRVESRPDRNFKRRITSEAESAGRDAGRRGGGFFASAFGGIAGKAVLGLAGAATAGLGALGFMGIRTAANLQQAQISFETLLGSGKEARSFLGELKDFSARTPFELPGLQDAARQMLGVGREAEDVIPALTAYGDAAGALGLNQESMNRVLLASSQAYAKGKLQGEEMLQMMEAGIPVTKLLADALGVPQSKISEMGAAGELVADEVLPKLEAQMAKEYGGAMAKQAQTLSGLWSTLMDTLNIGMAEALQPLIPMLTRSMPGAIDATAGALRFLAEGIARGAELLPQFIDGARRMWAGLQPLRDVLAVVASAIGGFIDRLRSGGDAVGPGGPLARGVQALRQLWGQVWPEIAAITQGAMQLVQAIVRQVVSFVTGFWQRGGEQLMATASRIWRAIVTIIRGALQVVRGIVDVFVGALTGDWSRFGQGLQRIAGGFMRVITGIIRGALDVIRGVVRVFVAAAQTLWAGLWTRINNTTRSIMNAVVGFLRDRLNDLTTRLRVWGFVFQLMWSNALGRVREAVTDWGRNLVSWFRGLPGRITSALGNIGQRIKDKFASILKGFSIPIKLAFGLGDGPGLGGMPGGSGSNTLMGASGAVAAAYSALGRPGDVISGFRPGAVTRSGNRSYHALRRALDISPIRAIAVAINKIFGSRTLELITPWHDLNLWHGRPHRYSAGTMADHSGAMAHIHWAMANGAYFRRPTVLPGNVMYAERGAELTSPVDVMAETFRRVLREGDGGKRPLIDTVNLYAWNARQAASQLADELAFYELANGGFG